MLLNSNQSNHTSCRSRPAQLLKRLYSVSRHNTEVLDTIAVTRLSPALTYPSVLARKITKPLPMRIHLSLHMSYGAASTHNKFSAETLACTHRKPTGSRRRASHVRKLQRTEAKMFVPDSFHGHTPERKAADALRNLFTYVAARIVLAQLQGSGRGNLAAYNPQSWTDLTEYMEQNDMRDGDAWLAGLMKKNQLLGVRIMEVRTAYCNEDFEWENTKRVAIRETEKANSRIMHTVAESAFAQAFTPKDQQADTDKGPSKG